MTGAGVVLGVLGVIGLWFLLCSVIGFLLTAMRHGMPAVIALRHQANLSIARHQQVRLDGRPAVVPTYLQAAVQRADAEIDVKRAAAIEAHRQYQARFGAR